jgi:hypothetical protein
MLTTGVGHFRDFLPAPQVRKTFFQSNPAFFWYRAVLILFWDSNANLSTG